MKKILPHLVLTAMLSVCIGWSNVANAQKIIGGYDHSVMLCTDSTVYIWGNNAYGELGNGGSANSISAVHIPSVSGITSVAARGRFTLALKNDSTVWAWGQNMQGQLGNGTTNTPGVNTPGQVDSLTGIKAIGAGRSHSFAVKNDGTVWAWGENNYAQLGNGTNVNSYVPVQVSSLTNVTAVTGGDGFSLALKADSTVWSWGALPLFGGGPSYALGIGNTTGQGSNIPVQVHGPGDVGFLTGIVAIAAGYQHALALKSDGTVWAWGMNADGWLGDGTNTNRSFPVQVSSLSNIIAIDAGEEHSIFLRNDSTVWTCGKSNNGQLGNGSSSTGSNVPVTISYYTGFTSIAAGESHCLALNGDGSLYTWGRNSNGQLGRGTFQSTFPVPDVATGACQPITTDIAALEDIKELQIFPNPSNGHFQLNISNISAAKPTIEIYNTTGQKVYAATITEQQNEIDISGLSKGIYFVKINDGAKIYSKKIIVQ